MSDSIDLNWSKCDGDVSYYEVRYRRKDDQEQWQIAKTNGNESQISITELMADTTYEFQVRGVFEDQKGEYSPANDNVQTIKSLATYLVELSTIVTPGNPEKRQLLAQELEKTRNVMAKTKKLILGMLVSCRFVYLSIYYLCLNFEMIILFLQLIAHQKINSMEKTLEYTKRR